MNFEEFNLSIDILKSIKRMGIETPTLIQERSIPHIVNGKDVIGQSATGSGKTLAFGCGIVESVEPGKGIQSLVLAPTRELAEQVKNALKELSKELKIISIYGGVSIDPQFQKLKTSDVVVATPGRLLDHMERRTIDLSRVKVLVLDEADRMLDMGFMEDVEKIIRQCPKNRQTLFFSATIPEEVKRMSHKYMNDPVKISATQMVDPKKLKQVYYDVTRSMKLSLLVHLLKNERSGLVMIFCNTKKNTDFVVKNLRANGVNAIAIHGGFSQNKRSKTLSMFNDAKVGVLVCTDVAARGLHIENVSHVYNYDIPKDPKDYVHRIGRTARAGEEGKVINLLCDFDYDNFNRVLSTYDVNIRKVNKPYVKKVVIKTERRDGRNRRRNTYRGGRRR